MPSVKFGLPKNTWISILSSLCTNIESDYNVNIQLTNNENLDVITITGDNKDACKNAKQEISNTYEKLKYSTEVYLENGIWDKIEEFGYDDIKEEHNVVIKYEGCDYGKRLDKEMVKIYGSTEEDCEAAIQSLLDLQKLVTVKDNVVDMEGKSEASNEKKESRDQQTNSNENGNGTQQHEEFTVQSEKWIKLRSSVDLKNFKENFNVRIEYYEEQFEVNIKIIGSNCKNAKKILIQMIESNEKMSRKLDRMNARDKKYKS